jgi:hypothetical protein
MNLFQKEREIYTMMNLFQKERGIYRVTVTNDTKKSVRFFTVHNTACKDPTAEINSIRLVFLVVVR